MHEVDRYPPGVPCWVEVSSPDPAGSRDFYAALFGWSFTAEIDGCRIGLSGDLDVAGVAVQPNDPGWTTFVRVDDAVEALGRATEAGARTLQVADRPPLARTAIVADPSGSTIGLWQPVDHGGAQLVNAPGSWNWSTFGTSDPDAALDFYGRAFGWEAMPMGDGVWLWRVPGYGDLLAARDPDLRERHDAPGIPPGFSDAVAWLAPPLDRLTAGWGVTFSVDDVDTVATDAAGLGGTVLTAPRDEGPSRLAVLADPHGAPFTVSHYAG